MDRVILTVVGSQNLFGKVIVTGDNGGLASPRCYTSIMLDIADATDRDSSRHVATDHDNEFTLSIEEVAERYAAAGHARTIRTLQRYCASGHLAAQKIATTTGDKYLVTPQSVARHLAQIEELQALDTVATDRDWSRHVATSVAAQQSASEQGTSQATSGDGGRPASTTHDTSPYVARLEREVEQAKDERDFLREQIDRKDKTIDSLIERGRETNILVRGLQEMLTPLLGAPHREPPADRPLH